MAQATNCGDLLLKSALTATAAFPLSARMSIRFRDPVRVPDGRIGDVVGFYRTKTEMALVQFDDGERRKFVLSELALVARN
jgi:hypothetical protein